MAMRGADGPDPIDVAVGARIKIRRHAIGMSQATLGDHLGVSFQQVQKYERGSNRISASMLVRTAEALGCPASVLLGDEGGPSLDAELLTLLSSSGAVDLLRAFSQVPESEARAAIVAVVQGLAGGAAQRSRRAARP